ncbi:MAG: gamma-glutamylcyclotransferase [Alphaproteobacteria bacterium]|uniref:gamma-glutamylcyclotransferase n=1 Tax=Pacificispira sp. TaxID=2888761 RepID=UPI001B284A50|nr:gamma-glutamylcyclotransferase [Alphaproteobacteria bacterium]MBO6863210.1 gamma-glutamylcyclotransferase [Alphaproteobacteria bacterium]
MARDAEAAGLIKPLDDAERRQSRIDTMAARPDGADIWIFGYGSLMWNPAFHYVERRIARLHGYHRSFCLQTPIGRGSPECPGLVLGLDRGGSVQGLALRIAEDQAEEELDVIWAREMLAGSYRPAWVTLVDEAGGRFHAIAFVMRRDCERYAGRLSFEETADRIARATGRLGPCSEYLERTVSAMDEIGIADGPMHALRARVRALKRELEGHPDE